VDWVISLLSMPHHLRVTIRRDPLGGRARGDMFLEKFVYLFERQTSRLGDEEVYVCKAGEVESPPQRNAIFVPKSAPLGLGSTM
jgi:hypothetical protein